MLQKKNLFLYILTSILLISCNSNIGKEGDIEEGIIEYSIGYPRVPTGDILLELLPQKMEMTFKDDSYRHDIVAGMGLFRTSIISRKGEEELLHTVKMLNTKYASSLAPSDLHTISPHFSNLSIELTNGSKKIAGYNCKEAIVSIKGDSTWSYKAYYTTEINIENPNRNTPFEEIKGVLMDYQLINYDIHMRFTAKSVYPKDIDNTMIELEEGYEMVSPTALGKEIKSIFAKIK